MPETIKIESYRDGKEDTEMTYAEDLANALVNGPLVEIVQSDEAKMKQRCIVIDVDGTLSDVQHRLEFNDKGKLNRKEFFEKMDKDSPIEPVVRLAQIYYQTGFIIHIVTARPATYKAQTVAWLEKHGVPYDFLHMRPADDSRQDSIVKQEILDKYLPEKSLIEFVLDDRKHVVDMWRANGLMCFQVNEHAF